MVTSAAESEPRGYTLKVSDFGLSHQFATDQTHQTNDHYGTVTHAAPEYMTGGTLSRPVDVYAYGMVLWEICAGKRPWAGVMHGDIIQRCACPPPRPSPRLLSEHRRSGTIGALTKYPPPGPPCTWAPGQNVVQAESLQNNA